MLLLGGLGVVKPAKATSQVITGWSLAPSVAPKSTAAVLVARASTVDVVCRSASSATASVGVAVL